MRAPEPGTPSANHESSWARSATSRRSPARRSTTGRSEAAATARTLSVIELFSEPSRTLVCSVSGPKGPEPLRAAPGLSRATWSGSGASAAASIRSYHRSRVAATMSVPAALSFATGSASSRAAACRVQAITARAGSPGRSSRPSSLPKAMTDGHCSQSARPSFELVPSKPGSGSSQAGPWTRSPTIHRYHSAGFGPGSPRSDHG